MIDIDPGLDSKLRGFFEHIESSTPPAGLTDIDVAVPDRGRRPVFNMFAGLAAAAVVAAGIALFAIELRGHDNPAPGPAARSASPSASQLKAMPLLGDSGVPTAAHVVIPLTRGQGSLQLQTFVPQGTLYIQFDCLGPGRYEIASTNHVIDNVLEQCSTDIGVTTLTIEGPKAYDDKPLTLRVTADPSMRWEVYVAQSSVLLPPLPTLQPDRQIVMPVTYGTGSAALPAFTIGPGETAIVQLECNSGSSADSLELSGDSILFQGKPTLQCSQTSSNGVGVAWPFPSSSGVINAQITADPLVNWEVQVIDGPDGIGLPEKGNLGPVTSDVSVAPAAFGIGSAEVPPFTPDQRYTMAFSCSGAGSLTIIIGGVTYVATTLCGGNTGWFTPPNQVPGQPLPLSVEAAPSVGWEIQPEQIYGSTWGAGGPNMSNRS
jgi:hypothetical protein